MALVHLNRLRGPLAALIGYVWGYPAEDLTGDPAPCPAGPGIKPPIGKFPVPILVVDVPTSRYGEVAAWYEKARGEDGAGTTMPTTHGAVQLVRDLRRTMYRRGAAFATGEKVGECGKFRAMFSYRVDADAMKREQGWEPNEQEGLQAEAATRAITVGELVNRARSEEEDLDKWLHMARTSTPPCRQQARPARTGPACMKEARRSPGTRGSFWSWHPGLASSR